MPNMQMLDISGDVYSLIVVKIYSNLILNCYMITAQ
jgi:hypothetical protein